MKKKTKKTWIQEIDPEAFEVRMPDFLHFVCCDCGLRHQVFVERAGKKIRIGMVRDDVATRKFKKLKRLNKTNKEEI